MIRNTIQTLTVLAMAMVLMAAGCKGEDLAVKNAARIKAKNDLDKTIGLIDQLTQEQAKEYITEQSKPIDTVQKKKVFRPTGHSSKLSSPTHRTL